MNRKEKLNYIIINSLPYTLPNILFTNFSFTPHLNYWLKAKKNTAYFYAVLLLTIYR